MSYIIVGLGNPGEEYENTRHNVGRIALEVFRKAEEFSPWEKDGKLNALVSKGTIKGAGKVLLVEPETFMNKSGASLKTLIAPQPSMKVMPKKPIELIVIHDDLDLPLGRIKVSFNKSAGGHRGVESVIKQIKSEAFIRVRVGISKATAKGIVKKPQGDDGINDFIIGKFKPAELDLIKKESKKIAEALVMIMTDSKERAMSIFNAA